MFRESAFSRYARRYRDLFLGEHRYLSVPPMLLQSIGHERGKSCAAEVSAGACEPSGPTVLTIQPSGPKLPAPPLDGRLDSSQQAFRAEPESTPASSLTKSRRAITQNGLSDGAKRSSSRLRQETASCWKAARFSRNLLPDFHANSANLVCDRIPPIHRRGTILATNKENWHALQKLRSAPAPAGPQGISATQSLSRLWFIPLGMPAVPQGADGEKAVCAQAAERAAARRRLGQRGARQLLSKMTENRQGLRIRTGRSSWRGRAHWRAARPAGA